MNLLAISGKREKFRVTEFVVYVIKSILMCVVKICITQYLVRYIYEEFFYVGFD